MSKTLKLAAACASLAICAGLPTAALAHADHDQVAPDAPNSMIVVRDAATGKLRAATAEEAAALQPKKAAAAEQRMLPRSHRSGAVGVRLTDAMANYSVVMRQADGTLKEVCFDSKEAADAAIKSGKLPTINALPTE